MMDRLLTLEQTAHILGMKRQAVYNKILNKDPLPPAIMMPHVRGYRFLESDVFDWIKSFRVEDIRKVKRPGRPRNAAGQK